MPIDRGPESLNQAIRHAIAAGGQGAISFRDYMDICLYHPVFGYYTSERPKVGKEGDFYTSANIGGIMGEMVARYVIDVFGGRKVEYRMIEWGGGTGLMASHILDAVQRLSPAIYAKLRYCLIERSPYHRAEQRKALQGHLGAAVWWAEEEWHAADKSIPTLIFANELLDAFPVHRVRMVDGILHELYVGWSDAEQSLAEEMRPCGNPEVLAYLEAEVSTLHDGQTIEVNLGAARWVADNVRRLEDGVLLAVDYGDRAEELYAAHRMNGTLMCYRRHQASENPYLHPGEQDMTAHVNFSACIRAAEENGCSSVKLQTQKEFLLENGVLGLLQDHVSADPFGPEVRRNRAVRQLLLSDGMSELFKVLVAVKDFAEKKVDPPKG